MTRYGRGNFISAYGIIINQYVQSHIKYHKSLDAIELAKRKKSLLNNCKHEHLIIMTFHPLNASKTPVQ